MSDLPAEGPFGDLPPEIRAMLEQLGSSGLLDQLQQALRGGGGSIGPVDWELARRVALTIAAEDDRPATAEEQRRLEDALQVAEHWLDASTLPAPPDAGQLVVGGRQQWVAAAITAMRPVVEPVAAAATAALADLARDQFDPELLRGTGLEGLLGGIDPAQALAPIGASLTGMQAGQVLGQLSRQMLGQYDLGLPTAPPAQALLVAVNIAEVTEGWDLDTTEVAIALALHEGAHRRLYHAVPWLEGHIHGLVATFAEGTVIDPRQLEELTSELMMGVDPEDPESMQEAMARAASFQLEPTLAQQRVLERLQGVVCLVQAWARREVDRAARDRLPNLGRIDEVLRRRRASKGDGEELLAQLLGLDLKPDDEEVGDRFVADVEGSHGPQALRDALGHPENLPDTEELADPAAWRARLGDRGAVPDDAAALFGDLADAPVEPSAAEREAQRRDAADTDDDADDADDADG